MNVSWSCHMKALGINSICLSIHTQPFSGRTVGTLNSEDCPQPHFSSPFPRTHVDLAITREGSAHGNLCPHLPLCRCSFPHSFFLIPYSVLFQGCSLTSSRPESLPSQPFSVLWFFNSFSLASMTPSLQLSTLPHPCSSKLQL